MLPQPPLLIDRTMNVAATAAALRSMLHLRTGSDDPLLDALLHVAGRYAEILVRCVNAAPAIHLEALGREIGARPTPPTPATGHVVFTAAPGVSRSTVVVPMHSRIAASAPRGDSEPVMFETLSDLDVVRAQLVQAVLVDPSRLEAIDLGPALLPHDPMLPLAHASRPMVMACHVAEPALFDMRNLREMSLDVRVEHGMAEEAARANGASVEWGIDTVDGFTPLTVARDTTVGLSRSGSVAFHAPQDWPATRRVEREVRWITVRLRRAIPMVAGRTTPLAAALTPRVQITGIDASAATQGVPPDQVCRETYPIDASKEFRPFGDRPQFGACWLVQSRALSEPGTQTTLTVAMTNPEGMVGGPVPAVTALGNPTLRWEISTRSGYQPLHIVDGTANITQEGAVEFVTPADVAPVQVGAVVAPAIRICLINGGYVTANKEGQPRDAAAPVLRGLTIQTTLRRHAEAAQYVIAQGMLTMRRRDPARAFDLFVLPDADQPALYLGIGWADKLAVGPRSVNLLVYPTPPVPPLASSTLESALPGQTPRWQCCTGKDWRDISFVQTSIAHSRPTLVGLEVPDVAQRWSCAETDPAGALLWLRRLEPPDAGNAIPAALFLNGVEVRQSERIRDEILGSATARPDQCFRTKRIPVVGAVDLRVRTGDGVAQRWQETEDLKEAGPTDEVFTLDRIDGTIRFGDGRHGRVPPTGPNNLRLASYHCGGGRRGNLPALALNALRTTIPGVAAVVNFCATDGGIDATDALHDGAPWAWLRHRDRAICADDYAALATRASAQVVRAFCHADGPPNTIVITVIVDGAGLRPQPAWEVLDAIRRYIDARRPAGPCLMVTGPSYARANVSAQVRAAPDESPHSVALACEAAITAFLHPLTGNGGDGWPPGKSPHRSDLFGLLGEMGGVAETVSLVLRFEDADRPGPGASARWIMSAGNVVVTASP